VQYLNESTGLKNETYVAKTETSPILSNRTNVLYRGNANLDYHQNTEKQKRDGKGWEQMNKHVWLLCGVVRRVGGRKNWWTVTVWHIRPLLDVLILNRGWLMDVLNSCFIYTQ